MAQQHQFNVLAPDLFNLCTRKKIMVAQALEGNRWTRHLKADMSPAALPQVVHIWELVQAMQLSPGSPYAVAWRWMLGGLARFVY